MFASEYQIGIKVLRKRVDCSFVAECKIIVAVIVGFVQIAISVLLFCSILSFSSFAGVV